MTKINLMLDFINHHQEKVNNGTKWFYADIANCEIKEVVGYKSGNILYYTDGSFMSIGSSILAFENIEGAKKLLIKNLENEIRNLQEKIKTVSEL